MKQLSFEDVEITYNITIEHRGESWSIEGLTKEQLDVHLDCLQKRLWSGWGYEVKKKTLTGV